jgi:hypothetical protein
MAEIINKDLITVTIDWLLKAEIYIFAAWCFNYMLVETLYVCMGFSLYINSRIEVEGWDIEIMFRGFSEKLKKKRANNVSTESFALSAQTTKLPVLLFVIFLSFFMFPPNVFADSEELSPEGDVPFDILLKILDSPDFGGEKDSWGIRLKTPLKTPNVPDVNINPMLEKLRAIFAFALRFILIAILAALIVFLFLYARKYFYKRKPALKESSMEILSGVPEAHPNELLEKAEDFYTKGNLRMAWGYCTAAAILSWPIYRRLSFPSNATEIDCAGIVTAESSLEPGNGIEAQMFGELINHWVNFAYAGRIPTEESFRQATAFCKSMRVPHG